MNPNNIINELEKNFQVFSGLLSDINQEQIKWKPSDDKWCLLEIVNHLYDEEREDFRARLEKILNKDHEWNPIDPAGWVKSRNYMQNDYSEVLKNFLDERKKSVEWLKNLNVKDWNVEAVHPEFGSFSAIQMLSSWLAHDYLHFRQIVRIKFEFLKESLKPLSVEYAGEW